MEPVKTNENTGTNYFWIIIIGVILLIASNVITHNIAYNVGVEKGMEIEDYNWYYHGSRRPNIHQSRNGLVFKMELIIEPIPLSGEVNGK